MATWVLGRYCDYVPTRYHASVVGRQPLRTISNNTVDYLSFPQVSGSTQPRHDIILARMKHNAGSGVLLS